MLTLLHAPTLALIVTSVLMTIACLMVFVLKTRTTYSGFGWWTAGFVLLAGCFIFSLLRDVLPQAPAILVSNLLGIASLSLFYDGMAGFYLRRNPRPDRLNWSLAIVAIAGLGFHLYRSGNINARIMWFNAFQFFLAVRVLCSFARYATGRQRPATLLMCAMLAGTGLISVWRFISAMSSPAMTNIMTQDTGYRLLILLSAMLTLMLAFSFLLLTHARIEEELHEARARAELAARTDLLTCLWNRRHFEAEAQREIGRANRYAQPVSLVLFDIDHFKQVNDRLGHLAGDDVLKQIAGIVHATVRASDLVCRWGGEEFAILMPVTIDEACAAAEKLRQAVAAAKLGHAGTLSISAGCAQLAPGEDLSGWIQRADDALYRAKKAGRDRVEKDTGAISKAASLAA